MQRFNFISGPVETFLVNFSLRVEPARGVFEDDTGVNNIKFGCHHLNDITGQPLNSTAKEIEGEGNNYGRYGDFSATCPNGSAICGIQTRVEKFRGPFRDDAGLTDVDFSCCKF
ncbi:hypothetical protein QYM36_014013 [Artemia franciscana]|uniref:Uncharacterized protein n=1 Tax=Artemia franciscana TaxID=6661 RepID=A0AA88KV52_ARTSF|nr:hypothetical protein QYM36_014013 [Artemia franciscana]